MAVDETLFKPERHIENAELFWKRAVGNVLLIFMLCVLAIVVWWPEDRPPNTIQFWAMIVGAPFAVSAISGLLLLMRRQNQAMDIAYENEAAAQVKNYVIEAASRLLALLAASYYHGSSPWEKSSKSISEKEPSRAWKFDEVRWFEHPEKDADVVPGPVDVLRHDALTSRIFADIFSDISPSLAALPSSVPCIVHLFIGNQLSEDENVTCWRDCLEVQTARNFPVVYSEKEQQGLMSLDKWMDDFIGGDSKEVRLIIGVQLLPCAKARLPPGGSTEAAAALMLVPDALASRYRLQRDANVYRPVKGRIADHAKSLSNALLFAGVKGKDVVNNWHIGVSAAQRSLLTIAENGQGVTSASVDIDRTVGVAGIAAPWFAIAYAHASMRRGNGAQMITAGREDDATTMVLKAPAEKGRRHIV